MYNNYEDEDDWDLPEEKDPFQEDLNQEICIGTSQVFLQPIAYMVTYINYLPILQFILFFVYWWLCFGYIKQISRLLFESGDLLQVSLFVACF